MVFEYQTKHSLSCSYITSRCLDIILINFLSCLFYHYVLNGVRYLMFDLLQKVLTILLPHLPGDTADFSGPCGGYEYVPNSTKNLTLLATGMSCQPAVQIVREIVADPTDKTSVVLLIYAEKPDGIPYQQELKQYAKYDKRLKLSFTVSEVDREDWEGGQGYIDSKLLSSSLPPSEESSHRVIVCGGPRMVMGVLQGMRKLGYSSDKIFVYGQFGVQQIKAVYGKFSKLAQHRETNDRANHQQA